MLESFSSPYGCGFSLRSLEAGGWPGWAAGRAASAEPGRQAASSPEAWRRPPRLAYLVFAGSQGRLVQLIFAQAVDLGHLRGRLFEAQALVS